jgi:hypothetical protein
MLIQISSGQGPTECSLAVEKLCKALQKEFKNTRIVSIISFPICRTIHLRQTGLHPFLGDRVVAWV